MIDSTEPPIDLAFEVVKEVDDAFGDYKARNGKYVNGGELFTEAADRIRPMLQPTPELDAAIALLEPIANFDWVGKWRIQKALEKLRNTATSSPLKCDLASLQLAGGAPLEPSDGKSTAAVASPAPANMFSNASDWPGEPGHYHTPDPVIQGEISVVSDAKHHVTLANILMTQAFVHHLEAMKSAVAATNYFKPYLRTTGPVSVEDMAARLWLHRNDGYPLWEAKASIRPKTVREVKRAYLDVKFVLEAAGVACVD